MMNKELCVGCGACKSICPNSCIELIKDEYGFLKYVIDYQKCINCKLCEDVCQINKKSQKNVSKSIYAVKNKNSQIRNNSSSGGVFSLLCGLYENFGFVAGVVYDKNFYVSHKIFSLKKDFVKFNQSKYMQSNLDGIYIKIAKLLKKEKKVLFSGTPCQCNGLIMFLNKLNISLENIIICDIICHGVPSQNTFEKYKDYLEKKQRERINKINFRYKDNESVQKLKIEFENSTYKSAPRNDPYYYAFLKGYGLMEKCYSCNFSEINRVSDITIGDFWGINDKHQDFNDGLGVSLVLINSEKGVDIFNKIKKNIEYLEITDGSYLQQSLISPLKKPNDNSNFKKIILNQDYNKIVDFLEEKKNV